MLAVVQVLNHKVHNWSNPKFVEILNKTRNSLGMQVKCERCDDEFASFADLGDHFQRLHPMKKLQICTSNPWGLAFLDLGC